MSEPLARGEAPPRAELTTNALGLRTVADGKFPYIMKLCFSSSRTIPSSFPPSSGGSSSSASANNGHAKMQQDSE